MDWDIWGLLLHKVPMVKAMRSVEKECRQCGECCSHLGLVHTIKEKRGNDEFLVNNEYTGEKTGVRIDPGRAALFADQSIFKMLPEACPFLRFEPGSGKGFCTVHLTRPAICRDFFCWRLLILDGAGSWVGRIMYQRYFCSDDPVLTTIWNQSVRTLDEPDDRVWEENMVHIITRAGYVVKR
jgi:Fe-S-cluster containining protein